MAGLDKILKGIEDEAAAQAEALILKAKEEAEQILTSAKEEAERTCSEIEAKSEADMNSAVSRAKSAANLYEKKLILQAKQEIIQDVIESAKQQLVDLPTDEYFETIKKMIGKQALKQEGEILFSSKDLARLPEHFSETIKEVLAEKDGAVLKISEKEVSIDGGFVLVYEDIELNCSFSSLFFSAKDTLQDKVSEIMFQ